MEFYFFHLMPYTDLPADFYDRYDSAWVTCPNELFDPRLGTELYNRYLDEMIYAEELGWDGVCVNEHHQTAYGLMPAPNLMASILARQTKRVRIAILGNAAPLYDQPLKVAEEVAMIDVISGGRVIAGCVRGVGCE
jgi:alkanesulfonate monooxygenase SsuD/methylene tetrahydromethanopterin reductase-like flavin-dependent oxidoreductase (luciferase family)